MARFTTTRRFCRRFADFVYFAASRLHSDSPGREEVSGRGETLDAVVAAIDDIHVSGAFVDRDTGGVHQLAAFRARFAEGRTERVSPMQEGGGRAARQEQAQERAAEGEDELKPKAARVTNAPPGTPAIHRFPSKHPVPFSVPLIKSPCLLQTV
jgi:hypothetical protein